MRRSPVVFIGFLLFLCVGAAVWQKLARNNLEHNGNGTSAPANVAVGIFSPVGRGLNAVAAWGGNVGRAVFRGGSTVEENEKLRSQVSELKGQVARLQSLKRENDELRRLAKVPPLPVGKVLTANIVAYDGTDTARKVVLNVGSRQGVRPKDVVYTGDGLIGQVDSVGPTVCFVLLPTDFTAGFGAKIARSGAQGLVNGTGESVCRMQYLPDSADVREGDTVVTSGIVQGRGQIYPGGMTIGRVIQVTRNKTLSQTEALVEPAVKVETLSVVNVRISSQS